MTTDEAIALLLGGTGCAQCGAPVTPGQPCTSCGAIPAMTGPELREALAASPLAVAAVEAAQAVADGYAMIDKAVEKIHDADRIRRVAILRLRRDDAQEALTAHQAERAKLYGPRSAARKGEEKAAAELANAQAEHAEIARAEEVARRYKAGVKAEADAAILLGEATKSLSRYQAEHSAAAARLRAAEDAVAQAAARGAQLEVARDAAVAALADPGRVPYGAEALHAGLMRLILGGKLDDAEMLIAGAFGQWVCAVTGAADTMAATVRSELLAEQEEAAKGKALHLRNTREGVVATPNPHNASTPQPFHAAQFPAGQVRPATTPGWS